MDVSVSRNRSFKFMSGIYLKYLFCSSLSLYKSLKLIYMVDLVMALITAVSLIPIT